jgi:DNA-binding FadR family transcriptional regulator
VKITDVIVEQMRYEIVAGRYVDGKCPSEAEIAALFDVARPTVREALRVLEAEGLITLHRGAGGGIKAHPPQVEVATRYVSLLLQARNTTIGELFVARRAIEPVAARLLAERRDDAACDRLQALVDRELTAIGDLDAFTEPGILFYREVTDSCGSELIAVFGAIIQELLEKAAPWILKQHLLGTELTAKAEQVAADQARLIRLLRTASPASVERFWLAHVNSLAAMLPQESNDMAFNAFSSRKRMKR